MAGGNQPTFLIPGVSRAGTTTLHSFLSEHPEIYMPPSKELRFFDRDENYNRGLEYYEGRFRSGETAVAIGEASPPYWYRGITFDEERNYCFDPTDDPPTRIHDAYPDLDVVFTLRNPVTRAYSQYWKNVSQGRERIYPFENAIEAELEGERDHRETAMCWYYKNEYSTHLKKWLDLFGEDQILTIVFEDWIQNPESTLDRVCEFLDVQPLENWPDTGRKRNVTRTPRNLRVNEIYHDYLRWTGIGELIYRLNLRTGYPDMDPEMATRLRDVFEPEIRAVERLFGHDLDIWREEHIGAEGTSTQSEP